MTHYSSSYYFLLIFNSHRDFDHKTVRFPHSSQLVCNKLIDRFSMLKQCGESHLTKDLLRNAERAPRQECACSKLIQFGHLQDVPLLSFSRSSFMRPKPNFSPLASLSCYISIIPCSFCLVSQFRLTFLGPACDSAGRCTARRY